MGHRRAEAIAGWRIAFEVPERALTVFSAALAGLAEAVATIEHPGGGWGIEAFASKPPDAVALGLALELAAASSSVAAPRPSIAAVPRIDWVAANYRDFPPIRAGRYFIHGSHWQGDAPAGSIGLRIDAATAFGSGEHGSTLGCLIALDRRARLKAPRRVLDLGCGTGILGLAAARTWRRRTLGVDIDPIAVEVAIDNARANGLSAFFRAAESPGLANWRVARAGPYDLVLANVLARPLMRLASPLARHLAPGGRVVLSGLLPGQAAQVLAAYRLQRVSLERRIEVEGWATLVLRRRRLR